MYCAARIEERRRLPQRHCAHIHAGCGRLAHLWAAEYVRRASALLQLINKCNVVLIFAISGWLLRAEAAGEEQKARAEQR